MTDGDKPGDLTEEAGRRARFDDACQRVRRLGHGLTQLMGPTEAVGVLLFAGVNLAVEVWGQEQAQAYLHNLVADFDEWQPPKVN